MKENVYNFKKFETRKSSSKSIFAGKIALNNSYKDEIALLIEIVKFNKTTKPKDVERKK